MESSHSPISEYVDRWRHGEAPSAQAVLRAHPELAKQKSVVLDLAYEEYCLRTEAGEQLVPSTFCDQFPTYRKSLERLLDVHELFGANAFGALARDFVWPRLGEEFLGFQLREELGKGALGRVFLASQPSMGNRLVALKLSRKGGREAEILGKLSHPNVVPVYSVHEDPESGLTAVCMPFLGTATLGDVIDRALVERRPVRARVIREAAAGEHAVAAAPSPTVRNRLCASPSYINAILGIGLQLARALRFAHSNGILHRDLKPSNMLLTPSGVPMLIDFNLSSDEQMSEMRVGGTLPYAAPEQLRAILAKEVGDTDEVDRRSDLFSLGVVIYELLTGELPFVDPGIESARPRSLLAASPVETSARAILDRQAEGAIRLRERGYPMDPAAAAVVERCLQFDPRRRPQSAAELIQLVERALAPRRRVIRWAGHHRALSAGASLAVAGVLMATTIMLATRDPYYLREYRAGLASYAAQNFDDAIEYFSAALKERPGDAGILFARAQAFERQGQFMTAAQDYEAAANRSGSGGAWAGGAYCRAQENLFADAIAWSQKAVDAGYRTAEVYNNLGYCQLKLKQLAAARDSLSRAIELKPRLQVAYLNRGMVDLSWLTKGAPPKSGIADFDRAIELGPASADLYFSAACLNAAAPGANRRGVAVKCLVAALEKGFSPDVVKAETLLANCRDAPEVARLLGRPSQPRRESHAVRLVSPAASALAGLP
jgi:eukaryotic-like serine/threonine-protein kinase